MPARMIASTCLKNACTSLFKYLQVLICVILVSYIHSTPTAIVFNSLVGGIVATVERNGSGRQKCLRAGWIYLPQSSPPAPLPQVTTTPPPVNGI